MDSITWRHGTILLCSVSRSCPSCQPRLFFSFLIFFICQTGWLTDLRLFSAPLFLFHVGLFDFIPEAVAHCLIVSSKQDLCPTGYFLLDKCKWPTVHCFCNPSVHCGCSPLEAQIEGHVLIGQRNPEKKTSLPLWSSAWLQFVRRKSDVQIYSRRDRQSWTFEISPF